MMNRNLSSVKSITSNCKDDNLLEICQTIVLFCTVVDVYVLICLVHFHCKERNPILVQLSRHKQECANERSISREVSKKESLPRRRSTIHGEGRDNFTMQQSPQNAFYSRGCSTYHRKNTNNFADKQFKKWMFRMAIAISFVSLVKYAAVQMKFFRLGASVQISLAKLLTMIQMESLYNLFIYFYG